MKKKKRPVSARRTKVAKAAKVSLGDKNEYLGVRLRHGRMTMGLRLRDLAEKAECSESMISKIENGPAGATPWSLDRKSTRLNSSHQIISYSVFSLKKKKHTISYITH